jgi:PilZ domain
MPRLPFIRLPRRQTRLYPLPPFVPSDRRKATRYPLIFPLRLRLGDDVFPGQASDLSVGGVGLRFAPQPDVAYALYQALVNHERGAIEVAFAHQCFVARVRITRSEAPEDDIQVGVAFDNPEEAERLIDWLEDYGTPISTRG